MAAKVAAAALAAFTVRGTAAESQAGDGVARADGLGTGIADFQRRRSERLQVILEARPLIGAGQIAAV